MGSREPTKPIDRYRKLPKSERRDLLSALWRLVLVRLTLFGGVRLTLRIFDGKSAALDIVNDEERGIWQRRARALRRIARLLPTTHCLARALTLRWWMRSEGLAAQLRIGIARGVRGLESHAWVDLGGEPVDETPENAARYRVIGNESDYRRRR